jgi:hypothetical protein
MSIPIMALFYNNLFNKMWPVKRGLCQPGHDAGLGSDTPTPDSPWEKSSPVQVYTDEGLIGIGECMTRLTPKALQAMVEDLTPILRGRDPRETDVL